MTHWNKLWSRIESLEKGRIERASQKSFFFYLFAALTSSWIIIWRCLKGGGEVLLIRLYSFETASSLQAPSSYHRPFRSYFLFIFPSFSRLSSIDLSRHHSCCLGERESVRYRGKINGGSLSYSTPFAHATSSQKPSLLCCVFAGALVFLQPATLDSLARSSYWFAPHPWTTWMTCIGTISR